MKNGASGGISGVVKDLLSLGLGSGAGYLFLLGLSPALTRLYEPSDFGVYGVFAAIYAVLTIIAPLGFDQGIVGVPRRTEALRLSATTHHFTAVICLGLLLLAWPMAGLLPDAAHLDPIMLMLAILTCWLSVFGSVAVNNAIRSGQARRAGASTFVNLAGRSALQLAFGFWWGNVYGLIAGEMLGRLVAYLVAETGATGRAFRRILSRPAASFAHLRQNADYARYLMPASALDVALVWIPAPLVTFTYGAAAGGLLVLIQRFASAPLTIVNQSLGQLFHLHASRAMASSSPGVVLRWVGGLAALALAAGAVVWLALWWRGRELFGFVFGEGWAHAADIALIWAPLIYVQFLSLLTNRLIIIMGTMRIKLAASVANIVLMLATVPLARLNGLDFEAAMLLMVGLLTACYAVAIAVVLVQAARYRPSASLPAA